MYLVCMKKIIKILFVSLMISAFADASNINEEGDREGLESVARRLLKTARAVAQEQLDQLQKEPRPHTLSQEEEKTLLEKVIRRHNVCEKILRGIR